MRTSRILTWTDVKKSLLLESKATGNSRFESAKFLRQRKKNSRYRKQLVILCCDNCTRLTAAKRSRLGNSILLVKRHGHSGHKKCWPLETNTFFTESTTPRPKGYPWPAWSPSKFVCTMSCHVGICYWSQKFRCADGAAPSNVGACCLKNITFP